MTPTSRRAPRSRDLQLSLTALLAFLSWAGLLAFFIVIPVLYLRKNAVPNLQSLKDSWALSAPMIIGGACLIVILFLLYYLMASNLKCQVCGGPVFGGGDTHRKHPNARKFLGLSYSRQVAWEILTRRGFHCMHCQTFCRNRRRAQATADQETEAPTGPAPQVFQPSQTQPIQESPVSSQLFNSLFAPVSNDPPQAPAPPMASSPASPTPAFTNSASSTAPAAPLPERTPWAHHPEVTPFATNKPANMNPPNSTPLAAPTLHPLIAPPIAVQPRPAQVPQAPSSPFSIVSQPPMQPAAPSPANVHPTPAPTMSAPTAFPPFVAPVAASAPAPVLPPAPAPMAPVVPAASAPAPVQPAATAPASGPTPTQVVTQVTKLIEKTRHSLDELFGNMLGELKKVMDAPAPASAPAARAPEFANHAAPAPAMAPAPVSKPAEVISRKPEAAPELPAMAPRPAAAPITLPSLPGMSPPKTMAPAASAPAAPAADKAAEMNAVLARAFAQSQRQPDAPAAPEAPASVAPAAPSSPDWRSGHPQSPFSLVNNREELPRTEASATITPPPAFQTPPNVLPFPPLPAPVSAPAVSSPMPPPFAPAANLPPLMPAPAAAASVSPFAVLQQGPGGSGPSNPSPFATLPELHQAPMEPIAMPAPFTFLSQQGDSFVPDPSKLPPQWSTPGAPPAAAPAPAPSQPAPNLADQQAIQFAQMQAQQLAQFQALQQAQLAAQQNGQPVLPPPFQPQWPAPNGNGQH